MQVDEHVLPGRYCNYEFLLLQFLLTCSDAVHNFNSSSGTNVAGKWIFITHFFYRELVDDSDKQA